MASKTQQPSTLPESPSTERLDSWKEIAAYLKRDERTVRRWEQEGMPVHRHMHKKQASVYAHKAEIDVWWKTGRQRLESPEPAPASKRPRLWLWAALSAAGVLALLAFTTTGLRERLSKKFAAANIHSMAVLPLKNLSGDPAQDYLADGMTEELIGRLAAIRNLRVISRTSVMRFKDTQLLVPEIAKTLGVDAVVEGSVMREGNQIRVHAQLIRAATDEHFWSESYDRDLRDVLALQSDVAQAIARKVEVTVTGEEQHRLAAVRPVAPEVYENYLKGKFALAQSTIRASVDQSIAYFNEAIRKDPTFAPSYMGLANAYSDRATVFMGGVAKQERPRAIAAAQKALELDPDLVEAHVLLGNLAQQQWRWAEAEAAYRRALELSPNNAEAHSAFAGWLVSQGRTEEAVTTCRRARELDPLAVSGSDLAWVLFYSRRYDDAVHELHSVLAGRPDDAFALWILGFALVANRHPEEAVPVLEKGVSASDRSPALIGLLIHAYAQAGRRPDALRLLEELKRRKQTGYVPAAAFVKAYLGLGDYDHAFFWLEEAYKEQSNILQFLKVHPIFDPVRGDPRFLNLVHRVGLD
jgi:TolB-like protein/lipopolysaccharide biosynthesis regulator YciM